MDTKICSACHTEKALDEFSLHPLGKHGRHSQCIECRRAYAREYQRRQRQEQPEHVKELKHQSDLRCADRVKAKSRAAYLMNREKRLVQAAAYRNANRERINAWQRQNYVNNKERKLAQDRTYVANNREKVSNRLKHYRNLHRAETRMRNRLRKVALKFSNANYKHQDWLDCLAYWHNACAVCGRSHSTDRQICADHWIPLKHNGLTHKNNILPLCHGVDGCNNHKHDKLPAAWLITMLGENAATKKLIEIQAYFDSLP